MFFDVFFILIPMYFTSMVFGCVSLFVCHFVCERDHGTRLYSCHRANYQSRLGTAQWIVTSPMTLIDVQGHFGYFRLKLTVVYFSAL